MAKAGDYYKVQLKPSHFKWGTYRYTDSREPIFEEGYIKIPSSVAENFNIYNSNYKGDVFGINLYHCASFDGFFKGVLRAQGNRGAGDIFAKQFSQDGNLKGIGRWYAHRNAKVGNTVLVEWTSPTEIVITLHKELNSNLVYEE